MFVLTNSNKPVGVVKGIQGVSQLIFALPAGYVADHFRRDRTLKGAGCIGVLACVVTFFAFQWNSLHVLYAAFAIWGVFYSFQNPTMEALFADALPHGQRSYPFTVKYILMNFALILGPLASIVLFLLYGDEWHLVELRTVLIFGTVIATMSMSWLFYFNDDLAHENIQAKRREQGIEAPIVHETTALLAKDDAEFYAASDNVNDADCLTQKKKKVSFMGLTPKHVPILMFISDFIVSNGAGMSINFFPLFFFQEYQLTPVHVNILFLLQPILISILSLLCQYGSVYCGRMQVVVGTRVISTFCLLYMAYAQPLWLQIILFLMRGGMMRCTQALRRSVLMDHVPKCQRARWNSLEGLTTFSWSGSAVIGGYLIDAYNYRYCFYITSIVYFSGLVVELLLLPLTHKLEHQCPEPSPFITKSLKK